MKRGHLRQRGARSWELKFDVSSPDGRRVTRTTTVRCDNRKEAERELTRLLVLADKGELPDASKATVAEYLDGYLESLLDVGGKTRERYNELSKHQIIPHLGGVKLASLKPEQIGGWHKALIDKGLAPRTVRHAHRLLSQTLKRAVDDGKLATNVARLRRPPRVERAKIEVLEPDQIPALLDGLANHYMQPIAALALATGMRRGELLALRWVEDVDLDGGVISVELSIEETRAAGLRIKSTKTEAGHRKVTIPPATVAMLRAHRAEQLRLRLALGQGGQPVLVFATIEGEMLSPDKLSRDWRRVCRAKKLPRVNFHALRHTHASILLASGLPVLTVSKRLGHSKASMTLDVYAHLLPNADDAAAKAIEGVLK